MDLSCMCFVCFVPTQHILNNISSQDKDGIVLEEKLKVILLELVNFRPEIPKYICKNCSQQLSYVYNFRLKGLRSITTLNEYLQQLEVQESYKNPLITLTEGKVHQLESENRNHREISDPNHKNDYLIEKCSQTNIPEAVFIKTEIDENLENENLQSSFDENLEENSRDDNVTVIQGHENNFKTFLPGFIEPANNITSINNTPPTDTTTTKATAQSENSRKRHKCNLCPKAFISARDLGRHTRTHTGERPYHCDVCHRAFGEKYSLKNHQRTHRNASQQSDTAAQNDAVSSESGGSSTQQPGGGSAQQSGGGGGVGGGGDKQHSCSVCGKSFFIPALLRRHMIIHTGERPHRCAECGATFKQSYNLTKHVRGTHAGLRPHVCAQCGKAYCDRSSLKNHQRSHNQPHRCHVCGRGFVHEDKLRAHLQVHDMGTAARLQCRVCGHHAHTDAELKLHLQDHPGEKPYVCPHCQTAFALLGSLQKHVQRKHKHLAAVNS